MTPKVNFSIRRILRKILLARRRATASYTSPLTVDLAKVKVSEPRPFVSIHVAVYNEKRVVERLIRACTAQEWATPISADDNRLAPIQLNQQKSAQSAKGSRAAYEVIIADDSTDETTEIAKNTLIGAGWKLIKTDVSSVIANEVKQSKKEIATSSQDSTRNDDKEAEIFIFTKPNAPTVKLIHRFSREGFKGGALQKALENTAAKAEYIVIFDADFVPYPDTIEQFVKTFQVLAPIEPIKTDLTDSAKSADFSQSVIAISSEAREKQSKTKIASSMTSRNDKGIVGYNNIAAVQGYQWHVLNKSQNWVTRGVRTEYAGSYVIERSTEELYGGLKQIAGSVYAIRADVLRQFGWGTSITEDFELTLRLYEAGYKIVFTPYIQVPAEAVSTIKRLIRQRMRWAEGSSFNIKVMFLRMLKSSHMSRAEKLEFLYFSFYYLQAVFFVVGTFSWFISETIFHAKLPFWTAAFGWSLVFTNLLALPLMNIVGMFLEESEERDYIGILSFIALSYIVVPFQAYAAIKGLLEREEGPWFRTPKTGLVTDTIKRMGLLHFAWPFGGRPAGVHANVSELNISENAHESVSHKLASVLSGRLAEVPVRTLTLRNKKIGRIILAFLVVFAIGLNFLLVKDSKVGQKAAIKVAAVLGQKPSDSLQASVSGMGGPDIPIIDPSIEQQINIVDQEYTTTSTTDVPTDNSLGLVYWDADLYTPAPTIYFEVIVKNSNTSTTTATLYDSAGNAVSGAAVSTTAALYTRVRSGSISLTDNTAYTVRMKTSAASGTAGILAARIVTVANDPTNLQETETQVEIGNSETTTATVENTLANPKYFQYDDSKYDGTKNAYFEATLQSGSSNNTEGFSTPGTSSTSTETGTVTWATPTEASRIQTDDTSYIIADPTDNQTTHYLRATNFGFTSIADATVVNGVEVEVIRLAETAGRIEWCSIRLVNAVGTIVGTDQVICQSEGTWDNADVTDTFGSATNTWGVSLTGTDVKDVDFGVALSAIKDTTAAVATQARIDRVRIRINWLTAQTVTAELYNRIDGAAVGNSAVTLTSTSFTRTRSAALTTNWDTASADEYEVRWKTADGTATLANAKIILTQSAVGGLAKMETYHEYINTDQTQNSASIGTFATTSQGQLAATRNNHTTVTSTVGSSTYVYVLGGSATSTVYKATLNSTTGDVSTFATTTQGQLPANREGSTTVTSTVGSSTYVYVLGGSTTSTVYKATLNSTTGDVSTFATTDQGQLLTNRTNHTTVTSTVGSSAYVYVLGGHISCPIPPCSYTSTVYKSTINATTGDVSTFDTTNQGQLLANRGLHTTVTSTIGSSTYVYVLGGGLDDDFATSTVYKATLNSTTGDVSTFATTTQGQLPATRNNHTTVTSTVGSSTYVYVLGGSATSTVYKATLNSTTGDVSTFATTSMGQLLTNRSDHTTVTSTIGYSTYLYVLGGSTASTVYKASLSNDYDSFKYVNLYNSANWIGGTFTYYHEGTLRPTRGSDNASGLSSISGSAANGRLVPGQLGAVAADGGNGNIGTFATTTQGQLPAIRSASTTVTSTVGSSTYVYVLGGSTTSTVYKATLNSTTGDVSTFATSTQGQLPATRSEHTTVTSTVGSSTYVYVLGGSDGTVQSTVYKATLNKGFERVRSGAVTLLVNGDVVTPIQTTYQGQLPATVTQHSTVTSTIGSSTYVYVLGGYDGVATISTIYKATLNSTTGDVSTFATTDQGQLPAIRIEHTTATSTVGSSTYVYVLGGTTGTAQSTIYKATLNSTTGDVSTFATTDQGQLPAARIEHSTITSTVGSSTYVYVLGGAVFSAASTVYKATLNSTTGDVSTFATTDQGQLPAIRIEHTTVTSTVGSSTYVYVLGGSTTSTVYKATLNSTTGDVSTFATTDQGQLLATRNVHATVVSTLGSSTYIYVLGGTTTSTVYKATLNSTTGDVSTFATTSQGQLAANRDEHTTVTAAIGSSTYIYTLGGNGTVSTVYKAALLPIVDTDDAGAFATTSQGQLVEAMAELSTITATIGSSTYTYVIGGCGVASCSAGQTKSTVYKATLNGTTGDASTFATTTQAQLVADSGAHTTEVATVGSSTYLYVLGGRRGAAEYSTVYKATLNGTTGDAGTFATTSQGQLPDEIYDLATAKATVGSSTYVYVLGGTPGISTVYKATLNGTTGDVSTFATASQGQLPANHQEHAAVTATVGSSTYLYVVGGIGNGGTGYSTVYRATLNSTTGDVSTFATTSQAQLPVVSQGLKEHAAVNLTISGRNNLFVFGGTTTGTTSTVFKGIIDSSGNVGTFSTNAQAQLPVAMDSQTTVTAAIDGTSYFYVLGSDVPASTVYKSQITTSGGGTEYDTQIQNAITNNSWLVINVASLQIPERLLALLPFGLLLPRLMEKWRAWRQRKKADYAD